MSTLPHSSHSSNAPTGFVELQRTGEVLTFTLNDPDRGNEVTGTMFEAVLAELGSESSQPRARVLRIRMRAVGLCNTLKIWRNLALPFFIKRSCIR